MESSLKKLQQNNFELTIELGREDLAGYVHQAEDKIAKEVQMDGFRKGKAPKEMIRDKIGEKHILEEALDIALQDSLARTIEKDKLDVLKVSDLNIKDNSASKLLYTVKVMMFPTITIGNLTGLKAGRREVSVDRKDIEDALEFLRNSRSKIIPIEKPVEKGNRVEIDFEVTSDGLPVEGGVSKNHPLVVGENKFIPGFEDQLVGMKEGEERKFSLVAPKDYFHKAVAGRNLDFKIKVISVKEIQKPALTDDFAKTLGNFKDIKDLEHNISGGILEEKKEKEKQRLRVEILSGIFERSKVELPEDMVKERLDDMVTRFDGELHMKGMELSLYLAHLNKTEDDLRKDWKEEAEKQVAFALILKKIAKDRNIRPTPQELEEEVAKIAQMMVARGEADQEKINLDGIKEMASSDITNEKVLSFLESTYVK